MAAFVYLDHAFDPSRKAFFLKWKSVFKNGTLGPGDHNGAQNAMISHHGKTAAPNAMTSQEISADCIRIFGLRGVVWHSLWHPAVGRVPTSSCFPVATACPSMGKHISAIACWIFWMEKCQIWCFTSAWNDRTLLGPTSVCQITGVACSATCPSLPFLQGMASCRCKTSSGKGPPIRTYSPHSTEILSSFAPLRCRAPWQF